MYNNFAAQNPKFHKVALGLTKKQLILFGSVLLGGVLTVILYLKYGKKKSKFKKRR